jgi:hypothetical protein
MKERRFAGSSEVMKIASKDHQYNSKELRECTTGTTKT